MRPGGQEVIYSSFNRRSGGQEVIYSSVNRRSGGQETIYRELQQEARRSRGHRVVLFLEYQSGWSRRLRPARRLVVLKFIKSPAGQPVSFR